MSSRLEYSSPIKNVGEVLERGEYNFFAGGEHVIVRPPHLPPTIYRLRLHTFKIKLLLLAGAGGARATPPAAVLHWVGVASGWAGLLRAGRLRQRQGSFARFACGSKLLSCVMVRLLGLLLFAWACWCHWRERLLRLLAKRVGSCWRDDTTLDNGLDCEFLDAYRFPR